MTTKPKRPANELGYTNIRVSKRAHRELTRRAIADRRSIGAQLDIILGV